MENKCNCCGSKRMGGNSEVCRGYIIPKIKTAAILAFFFGFFMACAIRVIFVGLFG